MAADTAALQPDTSSPTPQPETAQPEGQIRPLQALIGIVIRPVETFQKLRDSQRSTWWLVFAITIVTLALASFASSSALSRGMASLPAAASSNRAAGSQAAATQASGSRTMAGQTAAASTARSSSVLPRMALSLAGGAAMLLLDYLLRALIAFGMGLVLGGRISFKQAFRLGVWSTIPNALRNLVQSAAMLVTGQQSVSGLSAVLTTAETRAMPILSNVLEHIDFYMLWSVILLGVGLVATARISKGKGLAMASAYLGVALAGTLILFAGSSAVSGLLGSTLGGSTGGPGGAGGSILGGAGGGPGGSGPGGGGGGPPPGG
jgi:hypothetical protein